MDFSTVASRERDALECGVRDTAFKSDAAGVALQSAFGADNEAVDFTKIKLLDGQRTCDLWFMVNRFPHSPVLALPGL